MKTLLRQRITQAHGISLQSRGVEGPGSSRQKQREMIGFLECKRGEKTSFGELRWTTQPLR